VGERELGPDGGNTVGRRTDIRTAGWSAPILQSFKRLDIFLGGAARKEISDSLQPEIADLFFGAKNSKEQIADDNGPRADGIIV
jgi:hypothetical protein